MVHNCFECIAELYLVLCCYGFLYLHAWVLYLSFLCFFFFLLSLFGYQSNMNFNKMNLDFSASSICWKILCRIGVKISCETLLVWRFLFWELVSYEFISLIGRGLFSWCISHWVGCRLYFLKNWPMSSRVWHVWCLWGWKSGFCVVLSCKFWVLSPPGRDGSPCSALGLPWRPLGREVGTSEQLGGGRPGFPSTTHHSNSSILWNLGVWRHPSGLSESLIVSDLLWFSCLPSEWGPWEARLLLCFLSAWVLSKFWVFSSCLSQAVELDSISVAPGKWCSEHITSSVCPWLLTAWTPPALALSHPPSCNGLLLPLQRAGANYPGAYH